MDHEKGPERGSKITIELPGFANIGIQNLSLSDGAFVHVLTLLIFAVLCLLCFVPLWDGYEPNKYWEIGGMGKAYFFSSAIGILASLIALRHGSAEKHPSAVATFLEAKKIVTGVLLAAPLFTWAQIEASWHFSFWFWLMLWISIALAYVQLLHAFKSRRI